MICLENGADTMAPCMTYHLPLFHKKCLEISKYSQDNEPKCPHCNMCIPYLKCDNSTKMDSVMHNIESIMQRWLQDSGYWIKGPEYIQVNNTLMQPSEAHSSLISISKIIAEQLLKISSTKLYFSTPVDQDAIIYRHRDTSAGIETEVVIKRTAILNDSKLFSFRMDGYTISMSRFRYSPRYYRPPYTFDGKEKLFSE